MGLKSVEYEGKEVMGRLELTGKGGSYCPQTEFLFVFGRSLGPDFFFNFYYGIIHITSTLVIQD